MFSDRHHKEKSPDRANGQGFEPANPNNHEGSQPMNIVPLCANDVQTMSSREIADLTVKEHKNVIRDIRQMLENLDGSILSHEQYQEVKDARGYTSEFLLNKNLTLTLMTGYDVNTRHKINVRWQELEAKQSNVVSLPNFTDPAEAAIAWAAEFKAKQFAQVQVVQLEHKVTEMQEDVDTLDRIAKADGSLCITDAAKVLGMTRDKLTKWLHAHDWIYRRHGGGSWVGYSDKEKSGYVEHKLHDYESKDGSTKVNEQVRITPKGMVKLAKLLAKGDAA